MKDKPVVNILIAYPYFKEDVKQRLLQEPRENYRLIVDSGAFTAYQSGKLISIDGYCGFLKSIEALRPFHAVQLDVIGNHEATLNNYKEMRLRGFDVMPVFTRGAPLELLDELYSMTDYILVGGVAFGEKRKGYVKHLKEKLRGRKYHLLGFTDMDFVKTLRPYSVDSSGWESGARYGRMYLYQGFGKFKVVGREAFVPKVCPSIEPAFRRMGLTSKEAQLCTQPSAWTGGDSMVRFLSGYAHVVMSRDVERNLGTRYYMALAGKQPLEILLNSRTLLEERIKEGLL